MSPDLIAHLHLGIRTLAGHCDGALARDNVGFDGADAPFGHRLANHTMPTFSPFELMWMKQRCHKYRRQLGESFYGRLLALELLQSPEDTLPQETSTSHLGHSAVVVREAEAVRSVYDPLLDQTLDQVIPLTDEQEDALATIMSWHSQNDRPDFKLGGYAGTGKTTLIKVLIKELSRKTSIVVSAFTGKAVNVLQRKGVPAQTLHSLMYDVHEYEDGQITFSKKYTLQSDPGLIIVDEASMISTELHHDLCSFDVPMLFVGDPGQLEPVGDNPNLMAKPDLVLSKIHRQAEKSPIIRFATDIRLGRITRPQRCDGPELTIKDKVVRASEYLDASQIICAKNKTRQDLNKKIRVVKQYPSDTIVVGEKLICLRNNRQHCVYNGMILYVKRIHSETSTAWVCDLEDEVGTAYRRKLVWKEPFLIPTEREARVPWNHIFCDYGYVITCHKSQGSEWENVLVLDEWMPPSVWDMKRWRYTAITRAAKKLTFCV